MDARYGGVGPERQQWRYEFREGEAVPVDSEGHALRLHSIVPKSLNRRPPVVGEAADGAEAVALARELRPDVVLMDIRMPHVDGIEATRRLHAAGITPSPRVLVLTTFDLDEYVFGALRAGAAGFLLKDASRAHLVEAVHVVHDGEALLSPSITRRLIENFAARAEPRPAPSPLAAELTPREHETLLLVARGLSNTEIAARLVVTEATVKSHVGSMFAKLGLRDRAQAVVFAYEHGLIVAGETG